MRSFVVVTIKPWNIDAFNHYTKKINGKWTLISSPEGLTVENLESLDPDYVFFPHWSRKVPSNIIKKFNCVCFHMTDLPYGRGGSPLQNLIIRGHKTTKLSALKMTEKFDAGPIYLKSDLSLDGSAEEIFKRMASLSYQMIEVIINHNPIPKIQTGEVHVFKRRSPRESEIPKEYSLDKLYDFIRMLDAPSYPKGYLNYGEFKISFSDATCKNNKLMASVIIEKRE